MAIIREMGVECGGSNVQMAVNPADGEVRVKTLLLSKTRVDSTARSHLLHGQLVELLVWETWLPGNLSPYPYYISCGCLSAVIERCWLESL